MKRWLLGLTVSSLLLVNAYQARLVRLDVINKSGDEVAIRLQGKTLKEFYYLRIPSGTHPDPVEASFTVLADMYDTQVYYLQPEQTMRYLHCKQPKMVRLDFVHNIHLVILPCVHAPVYTGEPYMLKAPIKYTPY